MARADLNLSDQTVQYKLKCLNTFDTIGVGESRFPPLLTVDG